jgi:hypothetical protein
MKKILTVGLVCLFGLCFMGAPVDAGCRHCHKHKVAHRKVKVAERKLRKAEKKFANCNHCSAACSSACSTSCCSSACSTVCACPDNCPCRVNGVCSCGPNCKCPECPSHKTK